MTRIKVNWAHLGGLGKRTLENRDTFEASRTRLQELADELMNYWKGVDAEKYHKRITIFLDYLKGETDFMDRWGKYFGKASGNYKSGVEEGLKRIKQTNAVIDEVGNTANEMLIEDGMIGEMGAEYSEAFNMAPPDEETSDGGVRTIDVETDGSNSGHLDGYTVDAPSGQGPGGSALNEAPMSQIPENNGPRPDMEIPENHNPQPGDDYRNWIPENNNPQPDMEIPENHNPQPDDDYRNWIPENNGPSGNLDGYTTAPMLNGQGPGGSARSNPPMSQILENNGPYSGHINGYSYPYGNGGNN